MKFYKFTLAVLFLMLCGYMPVKAYLPGAGTASNPYLISTNDEFHEIQYNLRAYYKLTDNLTDLGFPYGWDNLTFTGHLDGDGHYIITRGVAFGSSYDNYDFGGLFSNCTGAEFKNLTIKCSVTLSTYNSRMGSDEFWGRYWNGNQWSLWLCYTSMNCGGICGVADNTSFENCHSELNLSASVSYSDDRSEYGVGANVFVGGLAGNAKSCTFSRCSNSGNISANLGGSWYGKGSGVSIPSSAYKPNHIGGIAGNAESSSFTNCFNTGALELTANNATLYANTESDGGICGGGKSITITNCYNSGAFKENGILGESTNSTVSDCFAICKNSNACGISGTAEVTNCYSSGTEDENVLDWDGESVSRDCFSIKSWYAENLPSWDFSNVWYLPSGSKSLPIFSNPVEISASGIAEYGETISFSSPNTAGSYSFSFIPSDAASINGNTITFRKAGKVHVTVTQIGAGEYSDSRKTFDFNVAKASLKISVKSVTVKQGEEIPPFEFHFSGFKGNDDQEDLNELPKIYCDATSQSAPGEYSIVLSGGSDDNYKYSLRAGKLTILKSDAVETIDATGDAVTQIFNTAGVQVSSDTSTLAPGIYIIVKNGNASKIIIR